MKRIKLLLVTCLFCVAGLAQNFNEILGRPTDSSITISILFDQTADVYWEYGTNTSSYTATTATYVASLNVPLEVDFTGLTPNTKYFYRTRYRTNGSSSAFLIGLEHSFHTQRDTGSTFQFTVEADEHLYDRSQGSPNLYQINLANQRKDSGDFMISLGDIFGDDHTPLTTTSADMKAKHLFYRQYLSAIANSSPFFVCLGNHEGENDFLLNQTPPNNIATYATLWRKYYYPNPYPNRFYAGNDSVEGYGMEHPENYYAWKWGNALFVVLDIYRDQCDTSADPKKWAWTLGSPQYTWLTNVLQNSTEKYKFVFCHHPNGQQRGGADAAKLFEWGGYEKTPSGGYVNKFGINRPGWAKPIHQLLVDNGVNIVFQGHDHLFAKETLDGIVYQEVPMAADSSYNSGVTMWGSYYSQNVINGSGHVRVKVSGDCVKVDYVQAYLPADTLGTNKNGQVAFSYTVGACGNILPISLLSFTGHRNNTKNTLQWTTANELNNTYFDIARSIDGIEFTKIGTKKEAGNSSAHLDYLFDDMAPLKAINYYRLKQFDNNGKFTFSKIIMIDNTHSGTGIKVYPNPAINTVAVEVGVAKSYDRLISITDVAGKTISNYTLQKGKTLLQINLHNLKSGAYFIKAFDGSNYEVSEMLVKH